MATAAQERESTGAEPGSSLRKTLQLYLHSLIEVSGWQLVAAVAIICVASLTEGVGVALLFPILEVAGFNLTNQGHVGHYTGEVRDFLTRSGLPHSLWLSLLLLLFVLLLAARSLFTRAQSVLTFNTVLNYELALGRQLYHSIINAQWLYLARRRASDFIHALTGELARVATATYLMIGALANAILAVMYIAIAFKLSGAMTLMVLAAGALLLVVSRQWMRAVHQSGAAVSETVSEVYAAATEHLQNLKAMKTYDAQANDLAMFSALQSSALREALRNTRSQAAAAFWFESGSLIVLGAVILVTLQVVKVSPGAVLLLLAVFTRLMPRLAAGNNQVQAFLAEIPAFATIVRLQRECLNQRETPAESTVMLSLQNELRLEHVSFAYQSETARVLDDLSLTIAAGKVTAVVGSSGAGKSTIADLVNGLLTANTGRVLIDQQELTPRLARAWRRQVGYVAQDTVLFHDSVRSNLLWAQPGATESDMREALMTSAAEFVFELPAGLDTVVGDRGILLSAGQRQRIALARALLRKPSLLILDEATNSLDLENERRILEAIEGLKGRVTVLMIAHRFSAIHRADMIYLVEHGRVAESGDWSTLSSIPSGRFGTLFRLQNVPG